MASGLIGLASLLLLAGGGYGLYFGYKRREPYDLVTETPTTDARQLSEPGTVELQGQVSADAETFTSPIGRRECVLAAWSVEEWDERGDHSDWTTVASGVWSAPFELEDGTGSVRVDAGDHAESRGLLTPVTDTAASDGVTAGPLHAEFDRFPVVEEVDPGDDPPAHIREFVRSERAVDEQTGSITNLIDIGRAHGHRRYSERTLAPGDDAYVLGEAVPRNPDAVGTFRPEDLVVRPGEGTMIVSNQDEDSIADQMKWYKLGIAGGMVAVVAGVVLLGAAAGAITVG